MVKIRATGAFTVGFAPDSIPTATPTNCGVWNSTTNYVRDQFIAPYVKYEGAYYLRISDGNCIGINPKTDVASQSRYWQHNEIIDLFCARKIQADEIDVENLTAARVSTGKKGPRVDIVGSEISVFGEVAKNIGIGVDTSGYAVFVFYDNNGNKLYDLGPSGFNWGSIKPASWTAGDRIKICNAIDSPSWIDVMEVLRLSLLPVETYYRYYAGSNPTITPEEREKEKYLYVSPNYNSEKIPDGWYAYSNEYRIYPSDNTGKLITPDPNGIYEMGTTVQDVSPIYVVCIELYRGGTAIDSKQIFFNGI